MSPVPAKVPAIPVLSAPTAAGKSALALALARDYPLEIVSADAFTVYRGLDIGTAKPTPAQRAAVPHHLLDVAEVTEAYDVARFVQGAETAIAGVLKRGRVPLVVGGTGFYLSALVSGLPLTPPSDPQVRAEVETELARRGLDALLADIAALDPAEAVRMERNPRRVVRAVELLRRTGTLPGHYGRTSPAFTYEVTAFTRPPEEQARRVQERLSAMFAAGWPAEAAWLASQVDPQARFHQVQLQQVQPPQLQPRPTVWQALGYAEALQVYRGSCSVPEAAARIALATRQYGKRQLTFLRTQLQAQPGSPGQAEARLRAQLDAWVGG